VKFTFLGTGTSQGIPVIGCTCEVCVSRDPRDQRNRCAAWIEMEGKHYLIDAGPDIRQQLLRTGIRSIAGVFLTHEHYDHIGGLDDLRPIGFLQGGIDIFGNATVLDAVKLKFDYAFREHKYPGAPKFHLHEILPELRIDSLPIDIVPIVVNHGHLKISGFIINQKLAYITDSNGFPEPTIQRLRNIDILIINALHHEPHHSHFTLAQTLAQIEILRPSKAFIIHMSHLLGRHENIQALLPLGVQLAYDFLSLEI
jgi:phosphoribosyl 1,2-cyclic phosphate phosphodiesterase